MTDEQAAHPPIVARDEWLASRIKLLAQEKELTKQRDRVNAERRRLPMVKIEKNYVFDTPEGKQSLLDLFGGGRQLVVYHFMFDPEWDKGCSGCTGYIDALGSLATLKDRDTSFVVVSRCQGRYEKWLCATLREARLLTPRQIACRTRLRSKSKLARP